MLYYIYGKCYKIYISSGANDICISSGDNAKYPNIVCWKSLLSLNSTADK